MAWPKNSSSAPLLNGPKMVVFITSPIITVCISGQYALKYSFALVYKIPWIVSSTFKIAQILVQSLFELVSSVLALEATEPVSEPVTQMVVELINNHLILVQQKR